MQSTFQTSSEYDAEVECKAKSKQYTIFSHITNNNYINTDTV